ncbi:MAG: type VII toxin-antitoxin system HepT family RNase toxin, partial [Candidatus Syntropharchaeia archaeon]
YRRKRDYMRKEIIRTKMKEIEESIRLVEEHLPDTFEEFSDLGLIKDGIYKRIEFAIENVFDICAIVNTDLEFGIPGDDKDIIENLVRSEILSEEMREKLKAMRGFKNIVVHRCGRIDDRIAFEILKESLPDFYAFIGKIEEFLEVYQGKKR